MNQFNRLLVWLSRIHRCRGFGIQSPSDYSFVRNVVNEHWPYYAYDTLKNDDWIIQKLGRLYFRLANWRHPLFMLPDKYEKFWLAGCRTIHFTTNINTVEMVRLDIDDAILYESSLSKCDEMSVMVVEGICNNMSRWHEMENDERTGTTFDLYYCGIIFFDKKRFKHHYKVNF